MKPQMDTELVAGEIIRSLRKQAKSRHGIRTLGRQNSYAAHYLSRILAAVITGPKYRAQETAVKDVAELIPELAA